MNSSFWLILATAFFFAASDSASAEQSSGERVPLGQRLTEREQGHLLRTIARCWNSRLVQEAAGPTSVRIVIDFDTDQRPTLIKPHKFQPTSAAVNERVFQTARRAIYRCSGLKLELPAERYQGWQTTVVTFALDGLKFETYTEIIEAVPDVIASAAPASVSNQVQSQIDPKALREARNECDRLASDPLDPNRRSEGIELANMDWVDARRWCKIAAYGDRSDLTSMSNFARALAEVDAVQSGKLIEGLSMSDYPISHYYMGVFYAAGDHGLQQSNAASVASFEIALGLGIPQAANRLGLYYARIGNKNAALRYWKIGAEMGYEPSVANSATLQAEMDAQTRMKSLFGHIPRRYPNYVTAVSLLRRYADTCTREQLSYCSSICSVMLDELIAEYSNVSRDILVRPFWDGCVGAVMRDTQ